VVDAKSFQLNVTGLNFSIASNPRVELKVFTFVFNLLSEVNATPFALTVP